MRNSNVRWFIHEYVGTIDMGNRLYRTPIERDIFKMRCRIFSSTPVLYRNLKV